MYSVLQHVLLADVPKSARATSSYHKLAARVMKVFANGAPKSMVTCLLIFLRASPARNRAVEAKHSAKQQRKMVQTQLELPMRASSRTRLLKRPARLIED